MDIGGKTLLTGLIGNNIAHSLSYAIHNTAFQECNLNGVYLPLRVAEGQLSHAIAGLKALNFLGANVTIPYKEKVIPLLDVLLPTAEKIGAVNTIFRNQAGKWCGDNTDAKGFQEDLIAHKIDITARNILILGAGGAARAVAYAVSELGCKQLQIWNRNHKRCRAIIQLVKEQFPDQECSIIQNLDNHNPTPNQAVINCTPIGNTDQDPPLWRHQIQPQQVIIDLIYRTTPLLSKARKAGAQTLDGKGMLIRQAHLSFQTWTGQNPTYHGISKRLEREQKLIH